tara:strand:+ start:120 stop:380 length:261 start_codon:yes stop_codon:yes gene_type:complete
MWRRFVMNTNPVSSSIPVWANPDVGISDHQMDIENRIGMLTERRYNHWSHGYVGDEVTIHNVDVKDVNSVVKKLYSAPKIGEIRRQ